MYKGEDCYRRGGSKLQSIFTLWPCYMVRKTAGGISTYKVELIKFIVLLFQQKKKKTAICFLKKRQL